MRVQVTVTSDTGIIYTGEAELAASTAGSSGRKARPGERKEPPQVMADIDFGLPVRPFMKKHAPLMTGPKRLTLLIAHIAKGDTKHQVQRAEVCKSWNKMTALMGGGQFNSVYGTRAMDNGWIGSPKSGTYTLLPTWKGIFEI